MKTTSGIYLPSICGKNSSPIGQDKDGVSPRQGSENPLFFEKTELKNFYKNPTLGIQYLHNEKPFEIE